MENKKLTYGYDANGERVYKLIGTNTTSQLNSANPYAEVFFDDAVLYPNPYIVISQTGYTKHYYAGTERLATVIGGGGFGDMESPIDKPTQREQEIVYAFDKQYQQSDPFLQGTVMSYPVPTEDIEGEQRGELEYLCQPTFLDYVDIPPMKDFLLGSIKQYTQANGPDKDVYFTHSDHLGSANWITDGLGKPIQYIHYAPYGELIENQHIGSWYDERYKFTGKERDWETGYDYFGARYYASGNLSWLSVDPLADKYPNISPYAYAAWNPIKYVDPDGMENVVALPNPAEETKQVIQSYESNGDVIHFFAHGEQNRIQISGKGDREKGGYITRPEQLNLFLLSNSEIWQEKETPENGGYAIIVFHSCATGQGENPIAQQISSSPEFENVLIVAPSDNIRIMSDITENVPA